MSIESILALTAVLSFFLFAALARAVQQMMWKVRASQLLTGDDADAAGIAYAGYYFGVLVVSTAVLDGGQHIAASSSETFSLAPYLFSIVFHGAIGITALALLGKAGLHLLVKTNITAGIKANNIAAGITAAAAYVSTGMVLAGPLSGENSGGDFSVTVLFLLIAVGTLWTVTYVFRFLTGYDDARQIAQGNTAAALSYAGMMTGSGMIIAHALNGDFTGYESSFILYGKSLIAVLLFYPVRQFLVQTILLGGPLKLYGGLLDDEVGERNNIGAGAVEAASYIIAAVIAIRLGY
ncbi:MAG: DUF350 domain-containing protein [Bacteroidota bacterium]